MTTYYIDPANGDDANSGTSLDDAFATFTPVESDGKSALQPGDTVKLRDTAVLYPSDRITWWKTAGTASERITIEAYENERPIIDCGNYDDHGIDMWGAQHITWRGIEIRNASRNAFRCVGTDTQDAIDCVFEDMEIHHYGSKSSWNGNGLIFYGRSFNHTVRDVVCHHGADDSDSDGFYVGGSAENGFSGGHTFIRCHAYYNADDGFDFFDNDPTKPSVMIDCTAHHNGTDGEGAVGDGNGFKVGGGWGTGGNILKRCRAWDNTARGFDCNGSSERNEFYHCTAWNNGTYGFHFTGDTDNGHYARNCASFNSGNAEVGSDWNVDSAYNTWDLGITSPSFVSTNETSDDFLRPTADSALVDAGTDVGMEFWGNAPDVGAVPSENGTAEATATASLMVRDGGAYAEPVGVRHFDGTSWTGAPMYVKQDGQFVQAMRAVDYTSSTDSSTGDSTGDTTDDSTSDTTTSSGVLEDFEGSSPLSNYAGDTGTFSVASGHPFEGDGYLESSSNGAVWHTGLDTEIGANYQARVWQFAGTFAQVLFCVDDASSGQADLSGYGIEVDFGWSKEISIVRYDDGSSTTLASTGCDQYQEQWNSVSFAIDGDGNISATAVSESGTEMATVSATDTQYASGKLGFGADNSVVGFDKLEKL